MVKGAKDTDMKLWTIKIQVEWGKKEIQKMEKVKESRFKDFDEVKEVVLQVSRKDLER